MTEATDRKQACAQDLRRRILSLEIEPGARLEEAQLSAHYEISRTPLREVLWGLRGEGYIQIDQGKGASVAPMGLETLRSFFETAPMIYANISRLAARNRSEAQLDDLRETQKGFENAVGFKLVDQAVLTNHVFHQIIGEMAQNQYLQASLFRLLIDHTRLAQTFFNAQNPREVKLVDQAVADHAALIEAITERQETRAVEVTLAHWDLSRDEMERFVRPDALPVEEFAESSAS